MVAIPSILNGDDTLKIAIELSDEQLSVLRNSGNDGKLVAERLKAMREVVWGGRRPGGSNIIAASKNDPSVLSMALAGMTQSQRSMFLESYARMGTLYEIAALTARENYLSSLRRNPREISPGGVEDFVSKKENAGKTIDQLVEQLNQPVFEVIMTAHPTNVYSLDSIKAQREIALALESGDRGKLQEAMVKYQQTPILQHGDDGKLRGLTVRDETENMLYFMSNIYDDLPKVYAHYDSVLGSVARKKDDVYDPLKLDLKAKLGAWGSSGDKDGNKSVTAETTLEAVAMHIDTALTKYSADLSELTGFPALSDWKAKIDAAHEKVSPLLEQIGKLREDAKELAAKPQNDVALARQLSRRFDELSSQLAEIRSGLDVSAFKKSLEEVAVNDEKALALLRRVRVFGFDFGRIEYRETAVDYGNAVSEILKEAGLAQDYRKMPPEERLQVMSNLLSGRFGKPSDILAKVNTTIERGAGKAYPDKKPDSDDYEPLAIAYNTVKRMQLARDFPDMFKDSVMAECGQLNQAFEPSPERTQAQGVANFLENQFLQEIVEKNGKRPKMNIVPLFEEPETMENAEGIMRGVYKNSACAAHLELMKKESGSEKPTQQIMVAHSDNARRSGVQAARGYIHEVHKKLRRLGREMGVATHFYEGGSISDAYRNGVRAISNNVDSFKIHDHAKLTFQGGDLPNYFNHPYSTTRIFDRSFAHQAGHMVKNSEGKWEVTRDKGVQDGKEIKVSNEIVDDVAIAAMKRTFGGGKSDYIGDFTADNMGRLVKMMDYDGWGKISNISSRVGARGGSKPQGDQAEKEKLSFAKVVSTGIAAITGVAIDDIRTIGFSMVQQAAAILPSWIGSVNLEKYLNEEVDSKYKILLKKYSDVIHDHGGVDKLSYDTLTAAEKAQLEGVADKGLAASPKRQIEYEIEFLQRLRVRAGGLTPDQIRFIYDKSPAFRDGQDKAGAGLVISKINTADTIMKNYMAKYYMDKTDCHSVEDAQQAAKQLIDGYDYWTHVKDTYRKAASLTYKSLTGKEAHMGNYDYSQIADKMRDEAFKFIKGDADAKLGYRDLMMDYRENNPNLLSAEHIKNPENQEEARLWAAAIQNVLHGRWLEWSDPRYAQDKAERLARSAGVFR